MSTTMTPTAPPTLPALPPFRLDYGHLRDLTTGQVIVGKRGEDTGDDVCRCVEQVRTGCTASPDETYARERLSVRVALLGCVSAGKSTLLNAILNRRLSDTKIKRTTMLPQVYLETGGGGACEGRTQQILEVNREANEAILSGKRALTVETCLGMYHHVPKLYDILDLPEGVHLDLLDVPGLNDAKTADVYYAYLDREYPFIDVILLVVDIAEGFNTEDSVQILDRIAANARKYPRRKVNVCVVANKCDDMEEEPESGELKCTDEELDEMFHQVLQTVTAKLGHLQHLEYEILRLSAEDSFVYRSFEQNPSLADLEPKLRNRLGVNEFGKRQWNRWDQAERDAHLRAYLANGDMAEALKLCGFKAFRAYLNQTIDGERQYDIAVGVFEYRLSRFSRQRSHESLRAAGAAYAEQAAEAARIDATYATRRRNEAGGEEVTGRAVRTVVDHFTHAVEEAWAAEGEGLAVGSEAAATRAEALKAALAAYAGSMVAPFGDVAAMLGERASRLEMRLCQWYASRLLAEETYCVEGPAGWAAIMRLCAKLKVHGYGDDAFATLLPEVHRRILALKYSSGVHGIGEEDVHPVVTYCETMATLLPHVPAHTWFALAAGYLHALVALDPPARFDLHVYVFRTLLARESARLDTRALPEALEGYLLALQCVNACELSHMSVAWRAEVKAHAGALKALTRAEKRRILSLYAYVLERAEVAEHADGAWEAAYDEVVSASVETGAFILKTMCGFNGNETELDLSERGLTAICAAQVAKQIVANGSLVSVNLLNNEFGVEQAQNLATILKEHPTLKSLCGNKGDETEIDMSDNCMGAEGAIMLAPEIVANGALTSLNISENYIGELVSPEGWSKNNHWNRELKTHNWYKHTDGREQKEAPEGLICAGAIALADAIKNHGAMVSFDISNNSLCAEGGKILSHALKDNNVLTELNISANSLSEIDGGEIDMSGVIAIVDAIPTMGALTSLDISSNDIGRLVFVEDGWTWDTSGDANSWMYKNTDGREQKETPPKEPKGAIALASAISTNGALTSLNISANNLGGLVAPTECPSGWKEGKNVGDGRRIFKPAEGGEWAFVVPLGAIVLVDTIKNNRTLASVNILYNDIGAEQANALIKIMESKPNLRTLCGFSGDETELDLTKKDLTTGCVVLVANEVKNNGAISYETITRESFDAFYAEHAPAELQASDWASYADDFLRSHSIEDVKRLFRERFEAVPKVTVISKAKGALVKLDVSGHDMFGYDDKSGIQALANAIKTNLSLLELNLAKNDMDTDDTKIFADGMRTNGTLTSLNISGNNIGQPVLPEGWFEDGGYFYGPNDEEQREPPEGSIPAGVIAIRNAIPTMGALKNLHIGNNRIPVESMNEIIAVVEAKPAMKVLCGIPFRDKTITGLNVSGQNLGVEGAIVLSRYLTNNGAMTKLDVSANNLLHREAGKAIASVLAANTVLLELNLSSNYNNGLRAENDASGFAEELAVGIRTNGALTSLDMSNNGINQDINGEEAAAPGKALADALAVNTVLKELNLSSNYLQASFVEAFAVGLGTNGALTSLNISNNSINYKIEREEAAAPGKALADALAVNTVLKELDLSRNSLKAPFAKELAVGLGANGVLTSLCLHGNNLGEEATKCVEDALAANMNVHDRTTSS